MFAFSLSSRRFCFRSHPPLWLVGFLLVLWHPSTLPLHGPSLPPQGQWYKNRTAAVAVNRRGTHSRKAMFPSRVLQGLPLPLARYFRRSEAPALPEQNQSNTEVCASLAEELQKYF